MQRISTASKAADLFGEGKDGFTDGNPAGVPATQLNASFFNSVQEEIANVIEGAGFELDKDNNAQLYAALLSAIRSGARNRLTANKTYYVATTGSDANGDGTAGAPWATVQKAIDYVTAYIDLSGYTTTIQLADGTYAPVLMERPVTGGCPTNLIIQGNAGSPANVIINAPDGHAAKAEGSGAGFLLKDLKLQASKVGIIANYHAEISISGVNFGACGEAHMSIYYQGSLRVLGNYTISGSSPSHFNSNENGVIVVNHFGITLTGTPAFSSVFASIGNNSTLAIDGTTFTGAATGKRYLITGGATLYTGGAGETYLPGSVAGTYSSGGQYI